MADTTQPAHMRKPTSSPTQCGGVRHDFQWVDREPRCVHCGRIANAEQVAAMVRPPAEHIEPRNITIALPPEVVQYEHEMRRFFDAMIYKLQVHAKKGKWENMPIHKAAGLLDGEVAELKEAINRGNLMEIMLESADVANFALIIASIAVERGK